MRNNGKIFYIERHKKAVFFNPTFAIGFENRDKKAESFYDKKVRAYPLRYESTFLEVKTN
jgi:hypothetical protein